MAAATSDLESLERRLRRLEDRVEIHELIARYGLVMDDRNMADMPGLFTPDVAIRSGDGVMNTVGLEAVVAMFRGKSAVIPGQVFPEEEGA